MLKRLPHATFLMDPMGHSHTSCEEHGVLAQCIATSGWSVIGIFPPVHHDRARTPI